MKPNVHTVRRSSYTTAPLVPGDFSQTAPEFGRISDIQKIFGLKRGTIYNLLKNRKISGCVLRVTGQQKGVRLISIDSVRNFIEKEMAVQNPSQSI